MRQAKFLIVFLVILMLGVLAFVLGRSKFKTRNSTSRVASPTFLQNRGGSEKSNRRVRNLSLQPEAFNMALRLGSRFVTEKRGSSVLIGTVTIGSESRGLHVKRVQTDDGEEVDIKIAGNPDFDWEASRGASSSGRRPAKQDRELIERLVLDSPDQFVLAQLRGAAYNIVGRNVRPVGAGDSYSGPLWNIVRVGEPESDDSNGSLTRWRLFYLNTKTGLIDKIESTLEGEKITALISWAKVNGEQVPIEIVWTRQEQTLMSYRISNFTHAVE